MCDVCDPAIQNEQKWIDIALNASKLLERAGLELPEGPLREECLAAHATIQTTPMYHPKRKSSGRVSYQDLKAGRAYAIDYPLF